jgi:thiamine-monophosphate kinase
MSKVGFVIDQVPIAPEAEKFALQNNLDPTELAFYGGEEYELVLTVKAHKWEASKALVEAVGGTLIPIGKATLEKQIVIEIDGEQRAIEARGWEHFKSQP